MTTIADRTYTRDEFLRLPDSVGYELIDGYLVERHVSELSSWVAAKILRLLGNEADKTNEVFVYGADLTYDCFPKETVKIRRADVSMIRASRLDGLNDPGCMPIPADLAVEVLSPNDEVYEVNKKVEAYLRAGFGLVWVVDPSTKIVFIHRRDGSIAKLHDTDWISAEDVLPSFRCSVSEFFRP